MGRMWDNKVCDACVQLRENLESNKEEGAERMREGGRTKRGCVTSWVLTRCVHHQELRRFGDLTLDVSLNLMLDLATFSTPWNSCLNCTPEIHNTNYGALVHPLSACLVRHVFSKGNSSQPCLASFIFLGRPADLIG